MIHSDNTGSEVSAISDRCPEIVLYRCAEQVAIRKGAAVSMDRSQLVHSQWTQAAEQGLELHILRVGTHDNIADLPSRAVGADGVRPLHCVSADRM